MPQDVLKTIEAATRLRVSSEMEGACSLEELRLLCDDPDEGARVYGARRGMSIEPRERGTFERALREPGLSFICEVKRASPSKGLIDPVFDYRGIARAYEKGGASCVSCLTEPQWFMGSDEVFMHVRETVSAPMIRKDFVVGAQEGDLALGEYQIRQARLMGADCVLLICSMLGEDALSRHLDLAASLGLDALVETHDENEVAMAARCGARIIGVNNRNLRDFTVDLDNARRMRELIPADCAYVAESGVRRLDDIAEISASGADAVLVGEFLMRADDKVRLLGEMRRAAGAR